MCIEQVILRVFRLGVVLNWCWVWRTIWTCTDFSSTPILNAHKAHCGTVLKKIWGFQFPKLDYIPMAIEAVPWPPSCGYYRSGCNGVRHNAPNYKQVRAPRNSSVTRHVVILATTHSAACHLVSTLTSHWRPLPAVFLLPKLTLLLDDHLALFYIPEV